MAKKSKRLKTSAFACALVLLFVGNAQAKFKIVHSFAGGFDGSSPTGDLFIDAHGILYGTTQNGGVGGDKGTLFKIEPGKKEKVVHSFSGGAGDGESPEGGVIADLSGNLYGTTQNGGVNNLGVVYKFAPDGSEALVHTFQGICCGIDGSFPIGNLLMDKRGNMYGATKAGGSPADLGSVFEINASGGESIVYGFAGGSDGSLPRSGPVRDKDGSLYGITQQGGGSCGVVYKITSAGSESVWHAFAGAPSDGCTPGSPLVLDQDGNVYGTTLNGGQDNSGTLYIVTPSGIETVLHAFCEQANCPDGSLPRSGLLRDKKSNLYGTAYNGGANNAGTVFELKSNGVFKVLHSFSGADGGHPVGGLVADARGNLYGTTVEGGANGLGVVFEIIARKR